MTRGLKSEGRWPARGPKQRACTALWRTSIRHQGAARNRSRYACGDGTGPAAPIGTAARHDEAPAATRKRGRPGLQIPRSQVVGSERFSRNKRQEWEQYRREVTPYERQRYLGAL